MEKFGLRKLQSESGATAVEYIIIALILVLIIAAVFTALGVSLGEAKDRVVACITGANSNGTTC